MVRPEIEFPIELILKKIVCINNEVRTDLLIDFRERTMETITAVKHNTTHARYYRQKISTYNVNNPHKQE
jgi:hypothetical protein